MQVIDKLYKRVQKLLALAGHNPSSHEAAAAAAKAQALIDNHKLDLAILAAMDANDEPPKLQDVAEDTLYTFKGRTLRMWVVQLGNGVADASGLYMWRGWEGRNRALRASGPADELAAAAQLLHWLVGEVGYLWSTIGDGAGRGRSYANSWRMGCAQQIASRLREQSREAKQRAQDKVKKANADRDLCYTAAIEARDVEALKELDEMPRYGLAVVDQAFEILAKQKQENKSWARAKHNFHHCSYGGTNRGGGYSNGVRAGNKARIDSGKGITG